MFTKDNVIFEKDTLLTTISNAIKYSKEEIIEAVCKYSNQIANELHVTIVKSISIDDIVLAPKTLGEMQIYCQCIKLSYVTAANLLSNINSSEFKHALATLYHEFYHALDCENIFPSIVLSEYALSGSNDIVLAYMMWTEFFATHLTFDIIEDLDLYQSFKCVFDKNKSIKWKTYYTSQLIGYQLKSNHNILCDSLLSDYLDKNSTSQLCKLYKSIIKRYPNINVDDLYKIFELTNKCINKTVDFSELKPISIEQLINRKK